MTSANGRQDTARPDVGRTLSSLKDFQRATVEYVFRRLWLDDDQVKRFLVADDLAGGRLVAPWGFVETSARLALWVPARRLDKRAQLLAAWLRHELQG